jgi:hypothetical protein
VSGRQVTALRLRWILLGASAAIGVPIALAFAQNPERAWPSYLVGLILATAAMELGTFNVRLAGRLAPNLSMAIAMLSYATTAIVLVLVLAASTPRVVSGLAAAAGLAAGAIIWAATQVMASWVRNEDCVRAQEDMRLEDAPTGGEENPVNISSRDGTSSGIR